VNVNSAEAQELMMATGIGEGTALNILVFLESRNAGGPFNSWEDLIDRVPKFPRKLQNFVTF
jgi:DNA uptake protein ComE-like DNA-binding protein